MSDRARIRGIGLRMALVLGVLVSATIGAVAFGAQGIEAVDLDPPSEGHGPSAVDWDDPLVGGTAVTESEASNLLAFSPVIPADLGTPEAILVNQTQNLNPSFRVLALIYEHPDYGKFWILERVPQATQAVLEAHAGPCDPALGCEGSWTMTQLDLLTRALQIEGGPLANALIWLKGGIQFDVLGPSDSFNASDAQEIAQSLLATQAEMEG